VDFDGKAEKKVQFYRALQIGSGATIVFFNDWIDSNDFVKSIGGVVVGLANGEGAIYRGYRTKLIDSGADIIIRGFRDWRKIVEALT
jgi:hypothetical protein